MAPAVDNTDRQLERQRVDRLGTPVQIAASVPLIVYTDKESRSTAMPFCHRPPEQALQSVVPSSRSPAESAAGSGVAAGYQLIVIRGGVDHSHLSPLTSDFSSLATCHWSLSRQSAAYAVQRYCSAEWRKNY